MKRRIILGKHYIFPRGTYNNYRIIQKRLLKHLVETIANNTRANAR